MSKRARDRKSLRRLMRRFTNEAMPFLAPKTVKFEDWINFRVSAGRGFGMTRTFIPPVET